MGDNMMKLVISAVDNASGVIKQVQQNVGQMTDTAKKAVGDFTNSLEKNKEALTSIRNTSAVAFAGVTGAIGLALNGYIKYQQAVKDVQIATNASNAQMEKHKKVVDDLAVQYGILPENILKGAEEIGKMGLSMDALNDGALKQTLLFQNAVGGNFEGSAKVLGTVMDQFKANVSELPGIVNQATGVINQTKMSLEDYSGALAQGGGIAAKLGVSLTDFNTIIALTASGFNSGSDAGTSFKTFIMRLVPTTKEASQTMKKLGLDFYDARGKMLPMREIAEQLKVKMAGLTDEQKSLAAATIFGADSARIALDLIDKGGKGFDEMNKKLEETNAFAQAGERMNTLGSLMNRLGVASSMVSRNIGEAFGPILEKIGQKMLPVIQSINERVKENPVLVQSLGLVALAFTGITTAVTTLGLVIPAIATGFATMTGPLLLVTGIVAAIGGAIYLLKLAWDNNFMGIQETTKAVRTEISSVLKTTRDNIKLGVQIFLAALKDFWAKYGDEIYAKASEVFGAIKEYLANTRNNIKIGVQTFLSIIKDFWSKYGADIMQVATTIASWIVQKFKDIRSFVGPIRSGLFSFLKDTAQNVWNMIVGIFKGVLNIIGGIIKIFSGVFTGDRQKARDGVKDIFKGIGGILTTLLQGAMTAVLDVIKGVGVSMKEYGGNAVKMLADGIMGGIDRVKNAVSSVADTIREYLGFASPTESGPASNSHTRGPNFVAMLANGIAGGVGMVKNAAGVVADGIKSGFEKLKTTDIKGMVTDKLDAIKTSMSNFRDSSGKQLPEIVQKYNDFKQGISETLSKLKSDYDSKIAGIVSKTKEIQNSFKEMTDSLKKENNSDQFSMAEKYVEAQKQAEATQKEIADKEKEMRQELNSDSAQGTSQRYNQELEALRLKLAEQQSALQANAFIETEYATQYAEAKKLAEMDELTRFVYLTQAKMAERQKEYNDKKAKLITELTDLMGQQQQIRAEYESSKRAINKTLADATAYYNERLEDQKKRTKKATEDMASYFDNVTKSINAMLAAQTAASKGGGGGSLKRAHGGLVSQHDVDNYQRYATGGIVSGPQGVDRVPAFLSAGELILNRAQQSNLAGQMGGGGQVNYITFSPQIFGSKEGMAEEIMNQFIKEFKSHTTFESR